MSVTISSPPFSTLNLKKRMRPFSMATIPDLKSIMSEFSPFGMYVQRFKFMRGSPKAHSWYIYNDNGVFLYRYYNQTSMSGKLKTSNKQDLGKISPQSLFSDHLAIDLNLVHKTSFNHYTMTMPVNSTQYYYYTFTVTINSQKCEYSWRYYRENDQWLLVKVSAYHKVLALFQRDATGESIGQLGFLTRLGQDEIVIFMMSLGLILDRQIRYMLRS